MLPKEYPKDIHKWLNDRGISDEVLNHNNISVVDRKVVIPVYSPERKFLFNKYRRDPHAPAESAPKYKYDKGSTSALYNVQNDVFKNDTIYICEGELDVMMMQSKGFFAVSSTGGAGTFKKEWKNDIGERHTIICYDNDKAGMQGAMKLLSIFPNAYVAFIPHKLGKDLTDVAMKGQSELRMVLNGAEKFRMPPTEDFESKEALQSATRICRSLGDHYLLMRQKMMMDDDRVEFVDLILEHIRNQYDVYNRGLKYVRPVIKDTEALLKARAVPVPEYVKFDRQGFAPCVSHEEKTPSMKYYKKNNKVKCFGCGFHGDTIDVVQKLFRLSVGEAIKKING